MKIDTYNQRGEKTGAIELPDAIFAVPMNADLVHQVVRVLALNRRQNSAHTKSRGEVSGGGRKPWQQKHTGRARHGSIRSPIWVGGGITFGPRSERNYSREINEKMRKKALYMVLSEMAKRNLLLVLEDLKIPEAKTRMVKEIFDQLPSKEESSLVILSAMDKTFLRAFRNLRNVQTMQAKDLNVLDVVQKKYIVMPKDAIEVLKKTFVEEKPSIKKQKEKVTTKK